MNVIKSDVKSIPADYIVLVIANFSISLLSIFITSMLTRMMTTSDYGVYGVFMFTTQTLLLFSSTWIINSIVRFGREEFDKSNKISRIFWAYSLVVSIMFLIGSLFILMFKSYVAEYIGIPDKTMWILLVYVFFLLVSSSFLSIYQATRKIRVFGALQVFDKLILLSVLGLFFVFYRRLSIEQLLYSFLISSGVFALINLTIADKTRLMPIKVNNDDLKGLLSFSSPLFISCSTAHFGMWISPVLINYFLTKDQLGIYYLAHQINFLVGSTILQLSIALTPVLVLIYSRNKLDLIYVYVRKLVPLGVMLWSLLVALGMLVAKFIFIKIFGEDFKFALLPMEILLLGTGFAAVHVLLAGVLTAYKLTWALTRAAVVYILVNLAGNLVFIKSFGILGAAIGTCVASVSYSCMILMETRRKIEFKTGILTLSALPALLAFMIFIFIRGFALTFAISVIAFTILVLLIKRTFFNPDLMYILNRLEFSNWTIDWIKNRYKSRN